MANRGPMSLVGLVQPEGACFEADIGLYYDTSAQILAIARGKNIELYQWTPTGMILQDIFYGKDEIADVKFATISNRKMLISMTTHGVITSYCFNPADGHSRDLLYQPEPREIGEDEMLMLAVDKQTGTIAQATSLGRLQFLIDGMGDGFLEVDSRCKNIASIAFIGARKIAILSHPDDCDDTIWKTIDLENAGEVVREEGVLNGKFHEIIPQFEPYYHNLLLGERQMILHSLNYTMRFFRPTHQMLATCTIRRACLLTISSDGRTFVAGTDDGALTLFRMQKVGALDSEGYNVDATSLHFEHSSKVSTMKSFIGHFFFAGSKTGDSAVYQILPSANRWPEIKMLEIFENLGPVNDILARNNNGEIEVLTASGEDGDGTIRVLNRNIRLHTCHQTQRAMIQNVFPLRATFTDEKDSYLLLSAARNSELLLINGNAPIRVQQTQFDGHSTLAAANLMDSPFVLQVTHTKIRWLKVNDPTFQMEFKQGYDYADRAVIDSVGACVLVARKTGLTKMNVTRHGHPDGSANLPDDAITNFQAKLYNNYITGISFANCDTTTAATHALLGFAEMSAIVKVDLETMNDVIVVAPLDHPPVSIFSHERYLIASDAQGNVYHWSSFDLMQVLPRTQPSHHTRVPPILYGINNRRGLAIGCSPDPIVVSARGGDMDVGSLESIQVVAACGLNADRFQNCVVVVGLNEVRIVKLNRSSKKTYIRETIVKLGLHNASETIVYVSHRSTTFLGVPIEPFAENRNVVAIRARDYDGTIPYERPERTYTISLRDKSLDKQFNTIEFDSREKFVSMIVGSFPSEVEEYVVLFTSTEQKLGRVAHVWLLHVAQNGDDWTLVNAGYHEILDAPVYCQFLDDGLYVACEKNVYKLSLDGNVFTSGRVGTFYYNPLSHMHPHPSYTLNPDYLNGSQRFVRAIIGPNAYKFGMVPTAFHAMLDFQAINNVNESPVLFGTKNGGLGWIVSLEPAWGCLLKAYEAHLQSVDLFRKYSDLFEEQPPTIIDLFLFQQFRKLSTVEQVYIRSLMNFNEYSFDDVLIRQAFFEAVDQFTVQWKLK